MTLEGSVKNLIEAASFISEAAKRFVSARKCEHTARIPIQVATDLKEQPELFEVCRYCGCWRVTRGTRLGPWTRPEYMRDFP